MKNRILSKHSVPLIVQVTSVIFFFFAVFIANKQAPASFEKKIKVYWFIPDGLRADRGQFNIFEWANNGELPNLRLLMARGSYGYSRPVFPGHTPTNFATLLTGVNPDKHGIADGAMRTFGYPLSMVSKGGFSSLAKLVAPIWTELEDKSYIVSLQSVPGSTPPEIFKGNVIKGRWGGWGVEFPSMVVEPEQKDEKLYKSLGHNRLVFASGPELMTFAHEKKTNFYEFKTWGQRFNIQVLKDAVTLSVNGSEYLLKEGQWSNWFMLPLTYELKNDYQIHSPKKTDWENQLSSVEVNVHAKVKLIALSDGKFRLRILFDSLNEYLTYPAVLADDMTKKLGPMVDFVDNYPPQLIYHKNDKQTFLEESKLSWDWHQRVVAYLMKDLKSDFIIHSVYNPNQMLTSRWWLPYIDNDGHLSQTISAEEKKLLWTEVKEMYREMDRVLGEVMKNADENTYIILSSDHGAIPLNNEVRLNNFFAKKGWLKFHYSERTKSYEIDWKETQVVFLQMNNIYINPRGLGDPYNPVHTKESKKLKEEVIKAINELRDDKTGKRILAGVWRREDVAEIHMPKERVGDLVISPLPGFSWVEDVSEDGEIVTGSLKGGYKQALNPEHIEGLLTPFVIAGPGIKTNFKIERVLQHVDQYATIAKITKINHPTKPVLDGKVINEIFYMDGK